MINQKIIKLLQSAFLEHILHIIAYALLQVTPSLRPFTRHTTAIIIIFPSSLPLVLSLSLAVSFNLFAWFVETTTGYEMKVVQPRMLSTSNYQPPVTCFWAVRTKSNPVSALISEYSAINPHEAVYNLFPALYLNTGIFLTSSIYCLLVPVSFLIWNTWRPFLCLGNTLFSCIFFSYYFTLYQRYPRITCWSRR